MLGIKLYTSPETGSFLPLGTETLFDRVFGLSEGKILEFPKKKTQGGFLIRAGASNPRPSDRNARVRQLLFSQIIVLNKSFCAAPNESTGPSVEPLLHVCVLKDAGKIVQVM